MSWEIRTADTVRVLPEDDAIILIARGRISSSAQIRPLGKTRWDPLAAHPPFAIALELASGSVVAVPAAPSTEERIDSTAPTR